MTRETYHKLKDKERILKNAVNMDFIHLTASEFSFYADIYKEVFGISLTRSQMNCNSCRLKAVKQIGAEYFKVALAYEKLDKEEAEVQTPKKEKKSRKKKVVDEPEQ